MAKSMRSQNVDQQQQSGSMQNMNAITTNAAESTASSSTNLTSLIKVSASAIVTNESADNERELVRTLTA